MGRCLSLSLIFSEVYGHRQQLEISGAGEGEEAKGVHGVSFWPNAYKEEYLSIKITYSWSLFLSFN